MLGLKKSGTSAGGKFDGPLVKKIILEENLQMLSQMLPSDLEPFINSVSVRTAFKPQDADSNLASVDNM